MDHIFYPLTIFALLAGVFYVFVLVFSSKKQKDSINTMMPIEPMQDDTIIGEIVEERFATGKTVSTEIAIIKAMLVKDHDYAWSWHCNLTMAYVDAGGNKLTAMRGSAKFLSIFAHVDITLDPRYMEEERRLLKQLNN